MEVVDWLESVSGPGWVWYLKRLSANDTLENEAHQAGPYIPKHVIFRVFPRLERPDTVNPSTTFPVAVDSHDDERELRAVWYNNKSRDEARITRWGGRASPVLNPENTGSLAVFAFYRPEAYENSRHARVWVSRGRDEELEVEDWIGSSVEPGSGLLALTEPVRAGTGGLNTVHLQRLDQGPSDCRLDESELPDSWTEEFPAASEIIRKAIELSGISVSRSADERLLERRECEEELFYSVEEATVLPMIREGFDSISDFVDLAHSVTNRRKSRSGRSLELHAQEIFDEEDLPYSYNEISEGRSRPDFLFPSVRAYQDASYPDDQLRMLAAKTTCKERWTQVLDEADRIEPKHLLTLQEGVTRRQFQKMKSNGIRLVVPEDLQTGYHDEIRPDLMSLEEFISETKRRSRPLQMTL